MVLCHPSLTLILAEALAQHQVASALGGALETKSEGNVHVRSRASASSGGLDCIGVRVVPHFAHARLLGVEATLRRIVHCPSWRGRHVVDGSEWLASPNKLLHIKKSHQVKIPLPYI